MTASHTEATDPAGAPRVGLLVTCLADLFRPSVGFAAVELLELAGCRVEVPAQTCCGQPAYNSGDLDDARAIARGVIRAFDGYDYVVAPSGSCAGMLRAHYAGLFEGDPDWQARAADLARRSWELTSFLHDLRGLRLDGIELAASCTYHDSCAGLRELGVREQPRQLLAQVRGLELRELEEREVCCGFGGTFCVKYPELSTRLVSDKLASAQATGAQLLVGGDLGCLLNIAGRQRRIGGELRVLHVAELLTGRGAEPGIGEDGS